MARLSAGTLAVAVVAVLLALTGAFAVRQFLEQRTEVTSVPSAVAEPDIVLIPVAVTDLEKGRVIRESDFSNIKIPRSEFARSKYAQKVFVNRVDQLKGRILRGDVAIGSTVGPTDLYAEGTGPTVADRLPEGMRAVTVKVNGAGFADGFAAPGTFVDVLFRSSGATDGDSEIPETTITALNRIEVLAVDLNSYPKNQSDVTGKKTDTQEARVTFAVVPSQATMLKALEDRGEISLALRSLAEVEQAIVQADQDQTAVSQERHPQTVLQILEGVKAAPVAVATTELVEGRVVRAGDVRLIESGKVASDHGGAATYADVESLVGRVLRSDVKPGEVITAALLYPEGVSPGVADRLAPGFRAVTVKMDEGSLIDGFVSPGTHVDVFFRASSVDGYPETTLRVLESLEVLAIEDRVSAGTDPKADQAGQGVRVTMAVPLSDVGKIQALEGHGTMTLAVRANHERSIGEIVRELESVQAALLKTEKHIKAFEQVSGLDESITLSKEQRERLAALLDERPRLEQRIELLKTEKDAATSGVSQTTLAEVLNLPEPKRPVKLEIYNGGSRETLVFNSERKLAPTTRTASRDSSEESKKTKNTSVETTKPSPDRKAISEKPDLDKVTLVTPERKVSAVENSSLDSKRVKRNAGRSDSVLSSFARFGEDLVAGLSRATQAGPRVEIVRGGVKE